MKLIKEFAIILAFLALGTVISTLIGHFIPGSVLGMLFLFAALCLRIVKPEAIRDVATFLTDNMTVFFIPAFIGIMDQWNVIRVSLLGWLFIMIVTTLIVMAVSGIGAEVMSSLNRKDREGRG